MKMAGLIILALLAFAGLTITIVNFYISFVRYPLHKSIKKKEPFHRVSGIPILGSLFLWFAALVLITHKESGFSLILVTLSLLDTGGFLWFVGVIVLQRLRPNKGNSDA